MLASVGIVVAVDDVVGARQARATTSNTPVSEVLVKWKLLAR